MISEMYKIKINIFYPSSYVDKYKTKQDRPAIYRQNKHLILKPVRQKRYVITISSVVFTAWFTVISMLPAFMWTSSCYAGTTHMRQVTDQTGRVIMIPDNPERVISLAPSITEIIYDLHKENYLKGATRYSDFPAQATKLPKIGSYVQLDLEKIVKLKPDLCIAVKDGNPIQTVQRLCSLSIPVYAVNPVNLDSIMDAITRMGDILKANTIAHSVVCNMRNRIHMVQTAVSKSDVKPKVFFQIGINPIVSAGTNTFLNELIELSKGINLGAGPDPYPRFSMEKIIKLNPDIILISSMARSRNDKIFKEMKKKWETWKMINAVKNKKIFIVDSDIFDRPTPRLVDGLELLAHIIHPEVFKKNIRKNIWEKTAK